MTSELRQYLRREVDRGRRERLAAEAAVQRERDRIVFELAERDELQKLRRRVRHLPRTCEACRESFIPRRGDARFCGNTCRQRAYRRRRAA